MRTCALLEKLILPPEPCWQLAANRPTDRASLPAPPRLLLLHPQDIEFTVQEGRLYMLQCRGGKRTGAAAVRIAVEMVSGSGMKTEGGNENICDTLLQNARADLARWPFH